MGQGAFGRDTSTRAVAGGHCAGDCVAAGSRLPASGLQPDRPRRLLGIGGRRPAGGRRPLPDGAGARRPGGAGRPLPDTGRKAADADRKAADADRPLPGGRRLAGGGRRRTTRAATLTLAVAATLAAAGCSAAAGAQTPPPSDGVGPITFAIGSDDISWLAPVIDKWNEANPGQRVTALLLPEASNVQLDQLVANLQAKSDVYDVIAIDVVWTAEFASNGWIIPLSPGKFDLSDFLKPAVNTVMYRGQLYAVPYYSNVHLLFYRKAPLAKAGEKPPTTWAELAQQASTLAPKYHLNGYAGTFAQYEGLTVNFAEAIQSAGGSIVNSNNTKVTLNTPQAEKGLEFLVNAFRRGWIPASTLNYEETSAQDAFKAGQYLFLSDWPDVWSYLGPDASRTYGVTQIPGENGPGSASLGGADLAISAYSQHEQTALRFIQYLTQPAQQQTMLETGTFPPVLKSLYSDPALTSQFPYLHVLYQAINDSQPRPSITNYDQASLVISSQVYQALTGLKTPQQALADMQAQLTQIIRDGLAAADRTGAGQPPQL
jgi:multiple sugar transport system substrate-binding protein